MKGQKRVGTLTMGISLIYIGIVLILSLFLKLNVILLCVRLFPIVLVFLGIEVLAFAITNKTEEKLKYDGISMLLILLFTFGAVMIASLGWGIQTYQNHVMQQSWYDFFNSAFTLQPTPHTSSIF